MPKFICHTCSPIMLRSWNGGRSAMTVASINPNYVIDCVHANSFTPAAMVAIMRPQKIDRTFIDGVKDLPRLDCEDSRIDLQHCSWLYKWDECASFAPITPNKDSAHASACRLGGPLFLSFCESRVSGVAFMMLIFAQFPEFQVDREAGYLWRVPSPDLSTKTWPRQFSSQA